MKKLHLCKSDKLVTIAANATKLNVFKRIIVSLISIMLFVTYKKRTNDFSCWFESQFIWNSKSITPPLWCFYSENRMLCDTWLIHVVQIFYTTIKSRKIVVGLVEKLHQQQTTTIKKQRMQNALRTHTHCLLNGDKFKFNLKFPF